MSRENVEVVRRLYELWNRRAFAAALDYYSPDIEYVRVTSDADFAGEWRGIEEMRQAVRQYLSAWTDYRYEIERVDDLRDRVLVLERQRGRGKRSGVETENVGGSVFTLRDGLVVRLVQYWDAADAVEAVGLSG